jgi:predicted dehydrogenase
MRKINWGILGVAKIAVNKVIPALQRSEFGRVVAIASRDEGKAAAAAARLGIPRAHGSYEALLADPEVNAVYIPLPNHLHVPWSRRALEAGQHVLCEKPLGLDAADVRDLIAAAAAHPRLKVMEAFMYRSHPQWLTARRMVGEGALGRLRTIQAFFSYSNPDPANIRNQANMGGGGLMDIGCYCISLARFLFGAEPTRVMGQAEDDPAFGVDRLTSAMLEFPGGTATFTCATQLAAYQRVNIFGTEGRLELEIPFNAPIDRGTRLWHQRGSDLHEITLPVCDQYTLQADLFARAILEDAPVPTPLSDALANLQVIEAVRASARLGRPVAPGAGA